MSAARSSVSTNPISSTPGSPWARAPRRSACVAVDSDSIPSTRESTVVPSRRQCSVLMPAAASENTTKVTALSYQRFTPSPASSTLPRARSSAGARSSRLTQNRAVSMVSSPAALSGCSCASACLLAAQAARAFVVRAPTPGPGPSTRAGSPRSASASSAAVCGRAVGAQHVEAEGVAADEHHDVALAGGPGPGVGVGRAGGVLAPRRGCGWPRTGTCAAPWSSARPGGWPGAASPVSTRCLWSSAPRISPAARPAWSCSAGSSLGVKRKKKLALRAMRSRRPR